MRVVRYVLALVLLMLFYYPGFSTPGCVVGGMYVYNVRDGSVGRVPNFFLDDPQDRYRVPYGAYCVRNTGAIGTSCYVTSDARGTNSAYGTLVDYSALPCPIDDCIPLLLTFTGFIGFYIIRYSSIKFKSS